jgi:hypothetical protein
MDRMQRIRLVAERYHELQGLRLVLVGCAFVVAFGAYALAGAPHGDWGFVGVLLAAFAGIGPGMWLLNRYYAQNFGRVARPQHSGVTWTIAGVAAASAVVNQVFDTSPGFTGLLVAPPFALWIGIRDWPLRAHHLAAGLVTAAAMALALTAPAADRDVAEAWAFAVFGAAYIPVGFLDHRILRDSCRRSGTAASRV